jgi:hypothetical protein
MQAWKAMDKAAGGAIGVGFAFLDLLMTGPVQC